jgi:2-keto-4-pentenoate hydratase
VTAPAESAVLEQAAAILRQAQESRTPVEPLTSMFADLTVADAWQIQTINRELALSSGRTIMGYKCGLTSAAMQQQMGVDEPDFGVLLDDMQVADGGQMLMRRFLQPRVEAEIILVLDRDLGSGTTLDDVLAATAHARPSLEIIDSRIKDWRLSLIDTVADNASSGAFVMGDPVGIDGLDLTAIEAVVTINGVETARGFGAAALGHPAAAAAWLANRLGDFGLVLEAGSVVMTGSLHASVPVSSGDVVVAEFAGLGSTSLNVY